MKYRSWREGDIPIQEVAPDLRTWDKIGIVLSICEDTFGWDHPEPAVDYMDASGDVYRARQSDLEVIRESVKELHEDR